MGRGSTRDMERYRELLGRLKRNKANVPLEELRTKYSKSYLELLDMLCTMTTELLQDIVLSGLLVKRIGATETCRRINQAIKESGLLSRIQYAVYQQQDADQVLQYAEQLREIVWQTARNEQIRKKPEGADGITGSVADSIRRN